MEVRWRVYAARWILYHLLDTGLSKHVSRRKIFSSSSSSKRQSEHVDFNQFSYHKDHRVY